MSQRDQRGEKQTVKLTEQIVADLPTPSEVFDAQVKGFHVRVYPSGERFYAVKYLVNGRQRRLSLGPATRGRLAKARNDAEDVRAKARLGTDVQAEKQAAREAARKRVTIGSLIDTYIDDQKSEWSPRYYTEVKRQLKNDWKPLHKYELGAVTRSDIVRVMDGIAMPRREGGRRRGGRTAADHAKATLSGFYTWCFDRSLYDGILPTTRLKPRVKNKRRKHVLSDAELADVWHASKSLKNERYGRIVRLLLLTAQRREEIGALTWPEINSKDRQLELPDTRTKNDERHIVPLSDAAIAELPTQREGFDYVFGRRRESGFSGWSKAKKELDEAIAERRKKRGSEDAMPRWVLHDLRRSADTYMNERDIAEPHVVEAILNHKKKGVERNYNRARYLVQRRNALEAWAQHVLVLVGEQEPSENVVLMKSA